MSRTLTWIDFFSSDAGRTCAEWEIAAFSAISRTMSGVRAVQIGCPAINALTGCAIAHQILVSEDVPASRESDIRAPVIAHPEAIPLAAECSDLIVWPHGLDSCSDKAACLAEIERVLAPNGILIASFLNAAGPWSMRRRLLRGSSVLPSPSSLVSVGEAKSLIAASSLVIEGGRFGVYTVNPDARPEEPRPVNSLRPTWLDKAGDRWWPTLGNMAVLIARKRTAGMTLIGKAAFGPSAARSGKRALAHRQSISKEKA